MRIKKRLAAMVTVALIAGSIAGCGNGNESAAIEPELPAVEVPANQPVEQEEQELQGEILIAVAASLQNAFEKELIPLFNEEFPGVKVTGTYDGSGKLQTQIEAGLEAALFFSAAAKQMNALIEAGLIDESTVVNLLENEVVLITGTDIDMDAVDTDSDGIIMHELEDGGTITSSLYTAVTGFENISDAKSIAIGDPASVPAGQYAEEILTSLGSWEEVSARASLGMNVTEVLNWVAEGSAEVGIVYMTDAMSMQDRVRVIAAATGDMLETPVVYPVGLMTGLGDRAEAAQAFLDFLKSPEAASVFASYGFKTI